jgi:hypothetical protein
MRRRGVDATYITVEPHSVLEKRIGRVFDTGRHGTGREGGLLDIAVVVLRVLVQDQTTDLVHGKVATRPNLGYVEGVEAELERVGLFGLHDLHLSCPLNLLSVLNCLPQLLLGVVWVLA